MSDEPTPYPGGVILPEANPGLVYEERDRLRAIIERADRKIGGIPWPQIAFDAGRLGDAGDQLARNLIPALEALAEARAILAEAAE